MILVFLVLVISIFTDLNVNLNIGYNSLLKYIDSYYFVVVLCHCSRYQISTTVFNRCCPTYFTTEVSGKL